MRRHTLTLLLLTTLSLVLAGFAPVNAPNAAGPGALLWAPAAAFAAEETPPDADAKTVKRALDRFKTEFDTADIDFKLQAVRSLAKVQHPSIAKVLLKQMKSKDEHVVSAAVDGLGNQKTSAKKIGSKVLKLLKDSGQPERVTLACVRTVFALNYAKASKELERLINHENDDVVMTVFQCYGAWKDDSAMKKMLLWWDIFPDEKEFKNVSVNVDTGTAGSGDQKAAQSKGRAMLAKQKSWRHRPKCTQALRDALKSITSKGFRLPTDLRSYLDKPKRYKDPELVLTRMPEAGQREVHAGYAKLIEQAKAKTDEKMPATDSDSSAKERGKLYLGELRKLRKAMIKERKISLSELMIILDEGKSKKW